MVQESDSRVVVLKCAASCRLEQERVSSESLQISWLLVVVVEEDRRLVGRE